MGTIVAADRLIPASAHGTCRWRLEITDDEPGILEITADHPQRPVTSYYMVTAQKKGFELRKIGKKKERYFVSTDCFHCDCPDQMFALSRGACKHRKALHAALLALALGKSGTFAY